MTLCFSYAPLVAPLLHIGLLVFHRKIFVFIVLWPQMLYGKGFTYNFAIVEKFKNP